MDKKIIIKKYENRRLYDATHSRYVNLDEVARSVQDGYEVQVLDASTGEDLTRLVMTQIIVESAKGPDSAFPLDVLRQMVVASGKASQESALTYMRAVGDMYKNTLRGFTKTMSPFEMMQKMIDTAAGEPTGPEDVSEPKTLQAMDNAKVETEVQELKHRIRELEALVLKKNKVSTTPKKKARRRASS
jgi:polyhydroxyalkanoate synthesis repressor PhaR